MSQDKLRVKNIQWQKEQGIIMDKLIEILLKYTWNMCMLCGRKEAVKEHLVISQTQEAILNWFKKEIVPTYEEYIKLLTEELNEVVPIAYIHGWKSNRYEQGKKLRKKLSNILTKIEERRR